MEKVLEIDGKQVGFKATALTPRLYRHKIGRDMVQDLNKLRNAYNRAMQLPEDTVEEEKAQAQLKAVDLEIFENAAYIMAFQYDSSIAATADEWLDGFTTFAIWEVLPHILELWCLNNQTSAIPKKK